MRPESLFLRYAFPCTFVKVQRGTIKEAELKELEQIARTDGHITRERLVSIYENAAAGIERLANSVGKDRWEFDVIAEYFHSFHNQIIDEGQGAYSVAPEALKDLCRVHVAVVQEIRAEILAVTYEYKGQIRRRNVLNHFVQEARLEEKVRIHYGYAVEFV